MVAVVLAKRPEVAQRSVTLIALVASIKAIVGACPDDGTLQHESMEGLGMKTKTFLLMVVPTRKSPLTLRATWVYSFLLYRSRCRLGTTRPDLSRITGFHRQTVKSTLDALLAHQLVEEKEGQLFPKDDHGQFFRRKTTQPKKWQDALQTVKVYLLSGEQTRITYSENVVLWLIHSYNAVGKHVHRKGIATQLRVSFQTVKRAIQHLRAEGLLDDQRHLIISQEAKDIWADQPVPEEAKAAEDSNFTLAMRVMQQFHEDYRPQFEMDFPAIRDNVKDLIGLMKQAEYNDHQIRAYFLEELPEMCSFGLSDHPAFSSLLLDCYLSRCIAQAFLAAEKFTTANRRSGNYHGPNSLGTFRSLSQSVFRVMKARLVDNGVDGVRRMSPRFDKYLHCEA